MVRMCVCVSTGMVGADCQGPAELRGRARQASLVPVIRTLQTSVDTGRDNNVALYSHTHASRHEMTGFSTVDLREPLRCFSVYGDDTEFLWYVSLVCVAMGVERCVCVCVCMYAHRSLSFPLPPYPQLWSHS